MPRPSEPAHVPRDERRRRTEQAILDAARELFADSGFERTTIRAVAGRAHVDPALVMQHYGSKEGLFAAAARWSADDAVSSAGPESLPAAALADMFDKFEGDGVEGEAAVALLRNCLTHPEAARVVRDDVMCDRISTVASVLPGPDAELRAALFGACMIGLTIARHLLEVEPLASADRADVERLMAPVLRALVDP